MGGEFPQLTSTLKKVIFQGRENFLLCMIPQTKWHLYKDYLVTNVSYTYGLVDTYNECYITHYVWALH